MAKGKLVCIIGCTGSGKTPICKELYKRIPNSVIFNMERGHGGRIYNPYKLEKYKKKPNKIIYFFGSFVFLFDLLIRSYKFNKLRKQGKDIICDRYYDLHLMPNVTKLIELLSVLLMPKPDYLFKLDVSYEELLKTDKGKIIGSHNLMLEILNINHIDNTISISGFNLKERVNAIIKCIK